MCKSHLTSVIIILNGQVYVGFYSIGMGAIPWVIMSEVATVTIPELGK